MRDGRIVEVMEVVGVVGVEGSRVLFERYLPLHDTVLKRYRVAWAAPRCGPPGSLLPARARPCWGGIAADRPPLGRARGGGGPPEGGVLGAEPLEPKRHATPFFIDSIETLRLETRLPGPVHCHSVECPDRGL